MHEIVHGTWSRCLHCWNGDVVYCSLLLYYLLLITICTVEPGSRRLPHARIPRCLKHWPLAMNECRVKELASLVTAALAILWTSLGGIAAAAGR